MIILVAGGAGFIGSHLCRKLYNEGHMIFCIDNLYTGLLSNIDDLKHKKGFSFLNVDIKDTAKVEDIGSIVDGVDRIYNLASPASVPAEQKKPITTILTNVIGSRNLLDLGRKHKARVLFASTSCVYGDPLVHPQKETYTGNVEPTSIRSCYDEAKRLAETIHMEYMRQFGVDIRIVRVFNTYGPGMNMEDGRVIPNFINQVINGNPLTVYGNGNQTRSFCYIDDMVNGIISMMENDNFTGPVNLGNPEEITMKDLANCIINHYGRGDIEYRPAIEDDPERRCPDIGLAMEKLSWSPKVTLFEGIAETIFDFEMRNHAG